MEQQTNQQTINNTHEVQMSSGSCSSPMERERNILQAQIYRIRNALCRGQIFWPDSGHQAVVAAEKIGDGIPRSGPRIGDSVEKVGGDYTFKGTVVAAFRKLPKTGAPPADRFVVEDDRGVLHIYSEKNLRPCKPS